MGAGLAAVATASLLATDAHTGLTEDTTHWQQRFNCLWVLAKSSKSLNSNQGKRRNSCLLLPFFSGFFWGGVFFVCLVFFQYPDPTAPNPAFTSSSAIHQAQDLNQGQNQIPGSCFIFLFQLPGETKGRLAESILPERAINLWLAFLSSGAVSVAHQCLRLGCKLCCSRSWADLKEVCGQCSESYRRKGEAKQRQRAKVEGAGGGEEDGGRCSPLPPPRGIFPRRCQGVSGSVGRERRGISPLMCFSSAPLYWWEAGRVPGSHCLLGIVVLPSSSGPLSCLPCPGSQWVRIRPFLSCPS